jgi:hypothetical protein
MGGQTKNQSERSERAWLFQFPHQGSWNNPVFPTKQKALHAVPGFFVGREPSLLERTGQRKRTANEVSKAFCFRIPPPRIME